MTQPHPYPTGRLAFISFLRFPLAALVVLIHSGICEYFTIQNDQTEMARRVVHGFSVGITSIAVPLFFAISGYLFFYGKELSTDAYRTKLKHRLKTLLIPYICWMFIAFLLYAGPSVTKGEPLKWPLSLDLWWGCRQLVPDYDCMLGYHVGQLTAPLLVPLWFVRDLMLLSLITPAIRWVLKRAGWAFIVFLAVVFYLHLYPNWGGVSVRGLLFFSCGAMFSINGTDPLEATRKWLPAAQWIALLSLIAYAVLWNQVHWAITDTLNAIYVWSGMLVAIHVAECASRRHSLPKMLSQSSFFVYAVHTLFLFVLLKPLALRVQHLGVTAILAAYFGCYAVTLLLSVLSYRVVAWTEHGYGLLTGIWNKRSC